LTYLVTSGFIFRPERYVAHMAFNLGLSPNSPRLPSYPPTWTGYLGLLHETSTWLMRATNEMMGSVALLGVVIAGLRERLVLAFGMPALSLLLTFICTIRYPQVRFLLPVSFSLACFAAFAVATGLQARHLVVRRLSVAVALGISFLGLVRGIDLTYAMWYDSRYAAADWLNMSAQPGTRIEYFGPYQKLPHVKPTVTFASVVPFQGVLVGPRPKLQYTREDIEMIANGIRERRPAFILVMPDVSSALGFPYGITLPLSLYELLHNGSLGYELTASFETPPLLPWVRRPPIIYYPVVNPPVQIFARTVRSVSEEAKQ
jgi:hypothetical protein